MRTTLSLAVAAAVVAGSGFAASAATLVSTTIDDNDCAGYFGTGFGSCQIFASDEGDIKLSPVIAKYNAALNLSEKNDDFPSFDGDEIAFSGLDYKSGTTEIIGGDWTYTPTGSDPGIRYWAAKYGNQFTLFWFVADAFISDDTCVAGDSVLNDTLACMTEALSVTSGSWLNLENKETSHITFYDSVPPSVIPLPAAGWLLLAGVGGLVAMRRKKAA